MKFTRLIAIATILILVVFILAGCDSTTAPEKEPPKKELPNPYAPGALDTELRYGPKKSIPPVDSPDEPTETSDEPTETSIEPVEKDTAKPGELATVTRIVDGDTIDVRFSDGRTERVRYTGIDTWETWDQPHGGHGTEANRELVEGKEVRLVKDVSERDKYDRLLRYVYVGGVFVNARLVEDGHAKAKDYPPDSAHAAEFADLERRAKASNKGCWVESAEPPAQQSGDLIGNRNSKKLHDLAHAACRGYVGKMSENNKVFFTSEAEANAAGYYACLRCP